MPSDGMERALRAERAQRVRQQNKRNLVVAIVALVVIIMVAVFYIKMIAPAGVPAEVATADNRDYFPVVHSLLAGAQSSIDVVLYQSRFYFEYPMSTSNTLIADLADASERGVRVRVVLEVADWNYDNSEDNRDVWMILTEAGVETYFDPVGTTSHSKLVVVDGKYSVVGSMNWSYYALDRNNEATAIVQSERIGKAFTAYFDRLVASSTKNYTLPLKALRAADVTGDEAQGLIVADVVDSARYSPADKQGRLYLGRLEVLADEDALNEVLAVDSLFFQRVAGESVRIFGRLDRSVPGLVHALDLETQATDRAMIRAFASERAAVKAAGVPKPTLTWVDAGRVVPIPNEAYAQEVGKILKNARQRIWLALLDARYYDKRPEYAERPPRRGPEGDLPSLTNALLADLEDAARRGVDVRLVIDMGRDGRMPPTKTAFLARLTAAGGKVYEDSPDITTHAKALIVDDDFSVVGSTNWSLPALEENNETAVLIESREINRHYAGFIAAASPEFPGAAGN
jgi:phosphatidylserine/phosphatidylglycerophosphate/cardiolipin synthase-like enzyme